VYTTGPPAWPAGADQPLHIRAVARRVFDQPPAIAARPEHRAHLREYLSDMVGPYGLSLEEDLDGHSYGEMGAALIGDLVAPEAAVDLLVLAFAIPDVRPGRAVATYLSHVCPGRPLAFAICDQGSAAGFTGLRLVREYARSGCRRALLLVLEQAGLPYDAGQPVAVPAAHTGVALLCDAAGGRARVASIRQHTGGAPDRVAGLLADEIAAAGDCLPIAGDGLPGARTAAAGRPHTGVWWELADALGRPGRAVLAAHDRQLGYLSVSTIDVQEGWGHGMGLGGP
jgi:hypothetical protein